MILNSLGYRTDLIFARFQGLAEDCGDVVRVVAPDNPAHYYGNFLIFAAPPQAGDLPVWEARFAALIGEPPRIRHRLFGWDIPATREADDRTFLHAGYVREDTAVMSATQLHRPEPRTAPVDLRVLPDTDEVWATVVDEQVACLDPRTGEPEAEYRTFKEGQFRRYRAMVRAGLGAWYGAFVNGRLAADLGVFTDGAGLLRFQAVNTHPDFRRQGLCSALTHFAGTHAQRVFGGHQLVIVADDHDVAKGIYERVGFRVVERQRLLLKRPPTS